MSKPNATIILLEDEATLRQLLADGLKDAGYAVVETVTGDEMKAAVAAAEGRTILVADRTVQKDGPNGFQLASEAMEQHPELRVIYVSGTHIAVRRRALGEQERALLKPFAMSQLLTLVRELGG